jgi:hypothetical protein
MLTPKTSGPESKLATEWDQVKDESGKQIVGGRNEKKKKSVGILGSSFVAN